MKKLFCSAIALILGVYLSQEAFSTHSSNGSAKKMQEEMGDQDQPIKLLTQDISQMNIGSVHLLTEDEGVTDEELKLKMEKMDDHVFAKAENYQNRADALLSEAKYEAAARYYLQSLETVFDNYDLHCFLKNIKFNYHKVPDVKDNSEAKKILVEDLAEKLELFFNK